MTKKINAYFGISKSNRIHFDKEIKILIKCLQKYGIDLLVFVDKYDFKIEQEKEMMEVAFKEIDFCDLVIVELSKKAIGVGVEVGYAKAKNKPIIYIKKKDTAYSTTVGGSSDYKIEYSNLEELRLEMDEVLNALI